MSYFVCGGPGCDVEMRQSDSYYCETCWRDGMGKTPRVEWRPVSDKGDGIHPSKSCDHCHRRSVKWFAQSTVCNSCFFKEKVNFREDVTNTLKFLRELHPFPDSKDFKGDVTFIVKRRDPSPDPDNRNHNAAQAHGRGAADVESHQHDQQHEPHQTPPDSALSDHDHETNGHGHTTVGEHEKHHDRPWNEPAAAKRQSVRIQAHRFLLASKSSRFRIMFETEAKQRHEEDTDERMRFMQEKLDDSDVENNVESRARQKHKKKRHDEAAEGHIDDEHEAESKMMRQDHRRHGDAKEKPWVFWLDHVEPAVLQAVIAFMYTAEIHFTEKVKPLEVLRFAHEYDISWLKRVCENQLAATITVKNLAEVLRMSYQWEANSLRKAARKFFEEHPEQHNEVLDSLLASGSSQ